MSIILPLSKDAIAQIKSSTTITSLNEVVLGLVENCLDARSSRIDIQVDYARESCTVEDDGLGIPPQEFRGDGGLARMYYSSKQNRASPSNSECHGGQGTFLASLAAMSLLSISSRHGQYYSHNALILHQAKVVSRLTPAPAQYALQNNASHGTRVVVRDLFGNMPVRVKQRALAMEDTTKTERNWQELKHKIVALLLPWEHHVTLRVVDGGNGSHRFTLRSGEVNVNALTERNLNTLNNRRGSHQLDNAIRLMIQAGYASPDSKETWIPASASTLTTSIKGFISLEPAPSKISQFISIGIAPCNDNTGHNTFYEIVNHAFSQSDFGIVESDSEPDLEEQKRRLNDRRYRQDGLTRKKMQKGRKGVDRWPMFYLRIESQQPSTGRTSVEPSEAHLKGISDLLQVLVLEWLTKHHFRPKSSRRGKHSSNEEDQGQSLRSSKRPWTAPNIDLNHEARFESSKSSTDQSDMVPARLIRPRSKSSKRQRESSASTYSKPLSCTDTSTARNSGFFADWSRIKSSKSAFYDHIWNGETRNANKPAVRPRPASALPALTIRSAGPELLDRQADDKDGNKTADEPSGLRVDHACADTQPHDQESDEGIWWTDPLTKERLLINKRTGVLIRGRTTVSEQQSSRTEHSMVGKSAFSSLRKPLSLQRRHPASASRGDSPATWTMDILQDWVNPVFSNRVEEPIHVAAPDGQEQAHFATTNACLHGERTIEETFIKAGFGMTSQLSKNDLQHARVIAQVDRKFILLEIMHATETTSGPTTSATRTLALVDQHAASERCISEKLLAELCKTDNEPALATSGLGCRSRIQTVKLDKPIHFQISADEGKMFETRASHFADWGILYDLHVNAIKAGSARKHDSSARLTVLALPPGIVERCKIEPRLLIELLRTDVYALADRGVTGTARVVEQAHDSDEPSWLRRLGSCPRGILDLLNSRACRSAIMFNDELSLQECERLVQQLSKCAFPFICAHGRVSMVPLVCLGAEAGFEKQPAGAGGLGNGWFGISEDAGPRESYAKSFRKWRASTA